MTRLLLLGMTMTAALGCGTVQPAGPLAKMMGDKPILGKPAAKPKADKDAPPPPVTVPAVKPTPPLNLVYPDEVMPENPQAALQKLVNELDADKKSMPAAPMTAEVSRYKGGVKQQ
jgi:hypothetical protein